MSVSQVEYDWLLRNYAAAVDALDFAHSDGFEWPHDPFGEVALVFADIDNARDRLPHNPDCAHCRKHAIADTRRMAETENTDSVRSTGSGGAAEQQSPNTSPRTCPS